MANKKPVADKTRKGDTSRTSSQGRKISSGGEIQKKGDPEIEESSKTPVRDINSLKKSRPKP